MPVVLIKRCIYKTNYKQLLEYKNDYEKAILKLLNHGWKSNKKYWVC
jgi:hypothetical protein